MALPYYQKIYRELERTCVKKESVRACLSGKWRGLEKGTTGSIKRHSKTMLTFNPDDKKMPKQWIVSLFDLACFHIPAINLMGEQ